MVSFSRGLIGRSAMADTTPPNTLRALPGIFTLTGEDMTTITDWRIQADAGVFTLTGQAADLLPPSAPLLVDGPAVRNAATANSVVLPALVTTKPNNIIIVTALASGPATSPSVTGSTLGAFTQRGTTLASVRAWWKLAPSPLAGEVITISFSAADYIAARAFAVNGAKISAPFDTNPSVPTLTSFGVPQDPGTFTTTASNTLLYAVWRMANQDSPVHGSGWTGIQETPGDYSLHEYKIVSSSGAQSVTIGTPGVGDGQQGFFDAIVRGP